MRKLLLFAVVMLFFVPVFSQQPGNVDSSYGTNGVADALPLGKSIIRMTVGRGDGNIVVIGFFGGTENYQNFIARYNRQGKLDRTFSGDGIQNLGGVYEFGFFDPLVSVQKDGKIILAAEKYIPSENPDEEPDADILLIRLNKNGSLDSTFGTNGSVSVDIGKEGQNKTYDSPTSIAIQSDGKILVSCISYFKENNYESFVAVLEYNPNGSVNTTHRFFSDFSEPGNSIELNNVKVSVYKEGGFVLTVQKHNGSVYLYSSRFGEQSISHPDINELFAGEQTHTLLADGKIALAKTWYKNKGSKSYVAMINANGSADTKFSGNGFLEFDSYLTEITSEPDGKIIVSDSVISRYNPDGTLDGTFKIDNEGHYKWGISDVQTYGNRLFEFSDRGITAYLLNTEDRNVKVNLYGNSNPYVNPEWNNWSNLRNRHFNGFYYSDSTASSINAYMSYRTGVNDNGVDYGGGMAPAGVLRHSSYSNAPRTITLSGLVASKYYSIELYGSRNAYDGNSTVFSINGTSKTVATYQNFTNAADFKNLKANAQGEIIINVSSTATYNYLNGFIITESFAATDFVTQAELVAVNKEKGLTVNSLQAKAFPNPSVNYFTFQLQSSSNQQVQLRIVDAAGRLVETKQGQSTNTTFTFGHKYKPGIYYVEVVQGNDRKTIKVIKAK